MRICYRLTAFDRRTDELMETHLIPAELVSEIKKIARIQAADDGAGDYPLNGKQAAKIGKRLGLTVHTESTEYFIEPYLDDAAVGGHTGR